MRDQDLYPIRVICEKTGLNPVTLRAWERRYGLFVPHRTKKGHRLYSPEDIDRVKQIQFFLEQGHPIRNIKSLLTQKTETAVSATPKSTPIIDFTRLENALRKLSLIAISNELKYFFSEYSPDGFAKTVYPEMLKHLNHNFWPSFDHAEIARGILLDILQSQLHQWLIQPRKETKQTTYVIGYRTGMIQTRLIPGLLLANSLKAQGENIRFLSNISHVKEACDLAKAEAESQVIIFMAKDTFYASKAKRNIESSQLKNIQLKVT